MRTINKVSALVLGIMSLVATAATAQTNSANITATAIVQTPINVTGAIALAFGNVFPGVAKTIGVAAVGAGRFDITGQSSAPANLSFTLPLNLTSGANNLPIGTWTGHVNTVNSPVGGTNFTPSAALQPFTFSATGAAFAFVGATVTPTVAQAAGTYTGTVTLTVTY